MTDNFDYKLDKSDNNELNDICDECKKEDETDELKQKTAGAGLTDND